jgi:hypothetical protein
MRRKLLLTAFVIFALLILTGTAQSAANKYGIADKRQVQFYNPVWVGTVQLPAGEYEVRHVMEGENHIMMFRQVNVRKPAEARVKCILISLAKPIEHTEIGFKLNPANELVLNRLAFKGDRAEHWF